MLKLPIHQHHQHHHNLNNVHQKYIYNANDAHIAMVHTHVNSMQWVEIDLNTSIHLSNTHSSVQLNWIEEWLTHFHHNVLSLPIITNKLTHPLCFSQFFFSLHFHIWLFFLKGTNPYQLYTVHSLLVSLTWIRPDF